VNRIMVWMFRWSMMLVETRLPLFGIMLYRAFNTSRISVKS
jgi:hypothetical protein